MYQLAGEGSRDSGFGITSYDGVCVRVLEFLVSGFRITSYDGVCTRVSGFGFRVSGFEITSGQRGS
jgi:hypothetical protein